MEKRLASLSEKIDRLMDATARIDERCRGMQEAISAGAEHQKECDAKHEQNQIRWAKAAGIAIGSGVFSGSAAAWISSLLER